MDWQRRIKEWQQHEVGRNVLFALGITLIIASPIVGVIPGPGGVLVFAAGLALALRNSRWAKRRYVRFKRRFPTQGEWADWGMRRASAKRRRERIKAREADYPLDGEIVRDRDGN